MRTVKIPKRIAKRRAELESEGYQVQRPDQAQDIILLTSSQLVSVTL